MKNPGRNAPPGSSSTVTDPLQYQNRLRFPGALEAAYRQDTAERVIPMQRFFFVFGFVLYGLFGILDFYAMPRTHHIAWLVRLAIEPLALLLFWASFRAAVRRQMVWIINLWMLVMNAGILIMIARAQESELAFTFYPIGLMLVMVCGYVGSWHLGFASAQGWLTILGYVLVAVVDQRMLVGQMASLKFFTMLFFLVGMNLVCLILGYILERTSRLSYLQRLVIQREHQESDRLLLNVLPAPVAARLKRGEVVADHFDQVGILFADLHGFTPYSARKRPADVLRVLNQVFSAFDALTERYGLEKIKTIGDAYMVVSGLPSPRADCLEALADMALEMHAVMEGFHRSGLCNLQLRIGIHTGPVVAGIIGFKKFSYDLWGDTVNVASRMESFGVPGSVQVTRQVYHLLKARYRFERRGRIVVKGKGEMLVYLLTGCKDSPQPASPALLPASAD